MEHHQPAKELRQGQELKSYEDIFAELVDYFSSTLGVKMLMYRLSLISCLRRFCDVNWRMRCLSFIGRLQLIQVVIFIIHNFWGRISLLPAKGCFKARLIWDNLRHRQENVPWAKVVRGLLPFLDIHSSPGQYPGLVVN
ncbi:hypothetical protein V6N12_051015 [Hibiscus sabdariffa]|uniref:Uncharacterized protein n=1 Tax=Hibiscus sabdariffa TaxID=183260 RepID=A0ABR2GE74_9ROSI